MSRADDARDAAMWRAVRDLARISGQVVLVDRIDTALVLVGGDRQTSEGRCLDDACAVACHRMGLDCEPVPQTIRAPELGSTEEGGL